MFSVAELVDSNVVSSLTSYPLVPPVEIFLLERQGVSNTSVGIHTGVGDLICKTYATVHTNASIHYEHLLLKWLGQAGLSFAVPTPIPTCRGALLSQESYSRLSLTPRLPGTPLDPDRLDHVELLGSALGELQMTLQHYPSTPRPGQSIYSTLFHFPPSSYDPFTVTATQLGFANTSLYDDQLRWWREEAAQLQVFVDGLYRTLPWQVCHNDLTPANVLVAGGHVSAVLDFEFAAPAPRALDLIMGLRNTTYVADHPEPWDVFRRFCIGYKRWLTLTEAEVHALPWLWRLRAALSVVWWLGRTDVPDAAARAFKYIGYLQNYVYWLARYGQQFVAVMGEAMA